MDLRADPIERITADGIRTVGKSGRREHALDVIVFATGFDAMTGPLLKMDIRGRAGRSLREDWKAGPGTYLGLQVPGFPNLFTITGWQPVCAHNMPALSSTVDWITLHRYLRATDRNARAPVQSMREMDRDGQEDASQRCVGCEDSGPGQRRASSGVMPMRAGSRAMPGLRRHCRARIREFVLGRLSPGVEIYTGRLGIGAAVSGRGLCPSSGSPRTRCRQGGELGTSCGRSCRF